MQRGKSEMAYREAPAAGESSPFSLDPCEVHTQLAILIGAERGTTFLARTCDPESET